MSARNIPITYVIDDLGYGGAQRQLSILVEHLPAPYRAVVVSTSPHVEPFGQVLSAAGAEVIALERHRGVDVQRLRSVARVIAATQTRIVHSFLDASNVYAHIAAAVRRRPIVLSMQSDRLRLHGWRAMILKRMLRSADAVTVNSQAGQDTLTRELNVNPDRVVLTPNLIPIPHLPAVRDRAPTAGFLGRLAPEKRVDRIVAAFAGVRSRIDGARLVLAGAGPERQNLEADVARLDLAGCVAFRQARPDVGGLLAEFDCLVLASEFEGLPNAALEALAAGVPIVAPGAGDVAQLIVEGETGVLVNDTSPEGFENAITKALGDVSLRSAARSAGPSLIRERYGFDANLKRVIDLYEKLLAGR